MGVAYYLEFDNEDLTIDEIDGKAVAGAMDALDDLSQQLGVKSLDDFMGQSMDDIGDMLGEDIAMQDGSSSAALWFAPTEGIAVVDALIQALKANPARIKGAKNVLADLQHYKDALLIADEHGAKWHLAMDF
jgi:hypothetical protein